MKFTNKHNFPYPIVEWLKHNDYDLQETDGIISATQLMKPARVYWLTKLFKDEMEIDVANRIASRYGEAIHKSYASMNFKNALQEERYFREIHDYNITGKPDLLMEIYQGDDLPLGYKIIDIKSTSAWKYVFQEVEEYIIQLSIYKWILTTDVLLAKDLSEDRKVEIGDIGEIYFHFTDWKRSDSLRNDKYPDTRILTQEYKLWDLNKTENYIDTRLTVLMQYVDVNKDTANDKLPDCTPKELWRPDDKWAVMAEGKKRAVRVFNSEVEAGNFLCDSRSNCSHDEHIEHRPGKVQRCNYCDCRSVCTQYDRIKEEGLLNE